MVETKGGEKVERYGRVSIRDSADDLTITVTIENLSKDDAGSYWCKIQTIWILDIFSRDPSFQVQVYVSPGVLGGAWVWTGREVAHLQPQAEPPSSTLLLVKLGGP
ncbi:Hypothetical predicted protein [Marmota monax]|uniref:Immunoglobulin V-set domain-containing protein n=1 Tax=Marmota monax TaxID=9995 RepID=A0A5E4CZZ4_MARMO|nr:Hypothetical predicted protein [Marmota monax]